MTTISTDSLAAVTLAELNAAASLLTRVDRKYLLPVHAAQDLVHALGDAQVLQIGWRRSFAYASTYFDTPELDSYYLAARWRRRRFKVRTRSYLDSDLTFLEVKTRGGRHTTLKSRTEYDRTDLLTEPGRRFVAECLATSGVCPQARADEVADTLMPALSTTYERTTLHLPADGARVTIDTTLTWSHPSAATGEVGETYQACGYAVVETKNPATPSPADRLLWAAGYRPTRVSKYATGMALLHPGLPANKWHRVMHRELAGGGHRELAQAGARPSTSAPAVGLLELVGARRRAEAPGRPPGALTRPRFSRGHSTCMRAAPGAPTDSLHPRPA